ncbi:unnamed protein product [Cylicostephanus goldi]|uniref:Uncharacterized protein n=1 Tax=Cylicostephanus goldi TaxID=71465 RepID=A0A3P6QQT1_CYLGO|nr:unnamed protein product [Cylicostephanus goldi]
MTRLLDSYEIDDSPTKAALVIQASLPLLFIFPPILIYGLYHLEFINFTIIEYLVSVISVLLNIPHLRRMVKSGIVPILRFSFYPATSPFVTLYFVKPFNLAVRRLVGLPVKVANISKYEPTVMTSMK